MDWSAVLLSMKLAFCTMWVLLGVGVPLSHWLSQTKSRIKVFIEALIALPVVLPPSVLGFYLLMAMGPKSPVGKFYGELTGGGLLPFSFQGLLLGSVLYSLPFAVQPFMTGFSTLDPQLKEASASLGGSRLQTFFYVTLPLCFPHILTGMILSFAHTLGEFGVVLMIGGNISGVTRTASVSVFDDVQAMNYLAAGKTSLFLLGVSFLVLVWMSYCKKKYFKRAS